MVQVWRWEYLADFSMKRNTGSLKFKYYLFMYLAYKFQTRQISKCFQRAKITQYTVTSG